MEHCGGPECCQDENCPCDCAKCGITQVADDAAVIDTVSQEVVSATVALFARSNDMVNLRCHCGRPSTHESGWCGECTISEF